MTIYKSQALFPRRNALLDPPPGSLICPLLLPHHKPLATLSHHCFNILGGCVGTRTCPRHLLAPHSVPGTVVPGENRSTLRETETHQSQAERWGPCLSATPIWPTDVLCSACTLFSNPFNKLATFERLESSTLKFTCQASASEQSAKTRSLSP